ncbi:uncharacterized protein ACBT44_005257 isoform 2-T2 [Syngnathus typhle]
MAPRIIGARKPLHHDKISLVIVFRCHALKCHQTHYPVNDQLCCPKCPIGSYVRSDCTENASISCRPCVTGTYMDSPTGLKICFPCKNCNAEADHTQSGEEREESSYRRLPRSPARLRSWSRDKIGVYQGLRHSVQTSGRLLLCGPSCGWVY